ncbi:hypothetical protein A3K93_13485 (plasmid) [Acinetobacter sp. NCu2D-2]|uniref:TetR/AcrR family transcriptional regulator n=1 Tax=Acinetobacter sp. NCu2D-2 TaxID=1608473 RepID=UPI0007CDA848|nr:TetR/AcrR family transcriptional regulator [Acinetobacter sp. NCu2D-2]ANF83253.1 hypothetical protein A3K93_13485 [Acinetobacter sp. NCu2D-2]
MARNKRVQDREEKRQEILQAARHLFLTEGYDSTSISRIASDAQVAANTIYWYFKNKDELLVSILNDDLNKQVHAYTSQSSKSLAERLIWVVDQLMQVNQLVSTVHSRIKVSHEIAAWHEQFHIMVEAMLRLELKNIGFSEQQLDARVKIAIFTIEGLLTHPLADAEKSEICHALVNPI